MTLYHGSTIDIPCIDLSLSKPNKDFGRAFYLSDDRQQALEMAQFRAEFEETEPVVNVYEFDEDLFQQFRYKRFEAYTEEWAQGEDPYTEIDNAAYKQAVESARRMKAKGFSVADIAEITGLTAKEIEVL